MTKTEVLSVIDKILKRYCHKFTFGHYDKDDLYQEGFIEALQNLEKYEGKSALSTYLTNCIRTFLIEFRRNNYSRADNCNNCAVFNPECESCLRRQQTYSAKRNLLRPIDISIVNADKEHSLTEHLNMFDDIETNELLQLIDKHLPVKYREEYLKMRDGIYVNKTIREEIETIIIDIINEHS